MTVCITAALLASCGDPVVSPGGIPPSPSIEIVSPPYTGDVSSYSTYIEFAWLPNGDDPAECTRYIWSEVVDTEGNYDPGFDFISDLNENRWRYEDRWSDWSCLTRESGPGWSLTLGDDEELRSGRYHFLAVQSMGRAGNVDTTFVRNINVRHFIPRRLSEPYLKVYEPVLGGFRFLGTTMNPVAVKVPPGIALRFRWDADPSKYFSELKGFRYGWDIEDPENWDGPYSTGVRSASTAEFNSGVHTLFIEAADMAGNVSLARIAVEIVPWYMQRDLLWIDDFESVDIPIPDYSWPPEYEHDAFWLGICSRAPGFDPSRDEYDCRQSALPPGVELVGGYRNIVWTYSIQNSDWAGIVRFIPESLTTLAGPSPRNVISIFLRKGGHLWTLGRSDRGGGLAAVSPESGLEFPFRVDREIAGTGTDDPSGRESMAWLDHCVTVIDKVQGNFRDHSWMPERLLDHHDVFRSAFLDAGDPVTASFAGLPADLRLRDEV
ncbi:MAG TPA: hypothetical protein VLA34_12560, partial [Candidatus Krumholzibacterium sp.]|nr:hypothetical protein [Candidatus Krumholzibacterium sp.]